MRLYKKLYQLMLLVILGLGIHCSTYEKEQYCERLLIEGKNGSGPGEIKWEKIGWEPTGPPSFAVNKKGEIFILDDQNHRIVKFDSNGEYIASFYITYNERSYVDLAFDNRGNLYLKYLDDTIEVFDKNMKHKRYIDLKKRGSGTMRGIEVTKNNTILFKDTQYPHDLFIEIDSNGNDIDSKYSINYYIKSKGEYYVKEWLTKRGTTDRSDVIYNTDGKELFSIKRIGLPYWDIIGIDSLKNIYTRYEIKNSNTERLLKVSPKGRILADFIIRYSSGHASISRTTRVSNAGHVYVLDGWYAEEKFQLWKYYPE